MALILLARREKQLHKSLSEVSPRYTRLISPSAYILSDGRFLDGYDKAIKASFRQNTSSILRKLSEEVDLGWQFMAAAEVIDDLYSKNEWVMRRTTFRENLRRVYNDADGLVGNLVQRWLNFQFEEGRAWVKYSEGGSLFFKKVEGPQEARPPASALWIDSDISVRERDSIIRHNAGWRSRMPRVCLINLVKPPPEIIKLKPTGGVYWELIDGQGLPEDKGLRTLPIAELGLSKRMTRILLEHDILTTDDLSRATISFMLRIPGFGLSSLNLLVDRLSDLHKKQWDGS